MIIIDVLIWAFKLVRVVAVVALIGIALWGWWLGR